MTIHSQKNGTFEQENIIQRVYTVKNGDIVERRNTVKKIDMLEREKTVEGKDTVKRKNTVERKGMVRRKVMVKGLIEKNNQEKRHNQRVGMPEREIQLGKKHS